MIIPLLVFAQTPSLDTKIEFRPTISVLSKTLAELGKQTKTKLTVSSALGKQVVAVHTEGETEREIMDRIWDVVILKRMQNPPPPLCSEGSGG